MEYDGARDADPLRILPSPASLAFPSSGPTGSAPESQPGPGHERPGPSDPCWRVTVGKKLYVGNLAYSVTSGDLEEMFSEFGTVQSAQVIEDRDTGRSKGFGFV